MKKLKYLLLITLFGISLTACNTNADNNQPSQSNEISGEQEQVRATNSDMNLLVIGIFNLENTDLAISSEQAANLLPYWKLLKSLTSSDITAQEEIEAVLLEINNGLTADQLTFINEMEYDSNNLLEMLEELGINIGGLGAGGNNLEGGFPDGGFPDGDFPSGGFGGGGCPGGGGGPGGGVPGQGRTGAGEVPIGVAPGGGVDLSPEQQATREALIEERGGAGGFSYPLIQAMITYLESK